MAYFCRFSSVGRVDGPIARARISDAVSDIASRSATLIAHCADRRGRVLRINRLKPIAPLFSLNGQTKIIFNHLKFPKSKNSLMQIFLPSLAFYHSPAPQPPTSPPGNKKGWQGLRPPASPPKPLRTPQNEPQALPSRHPRTDRHHRRATHPHPRQDRAGSRPG